MTIKIVIPGEPVAKGRPRFNRKTGIAYTPSKTKGYETLIREIAYGLLKPIDGAVEIRIVFCFSRPKNKYWKSKPMPRYPKTTRGDLDNFVKSTLDALNGIAYHDDSQVYKIIAEKVVCAGDESPHTEIEIISLKGGNLNG